LGEKVAAEWGSKPEKKRGSISLEGPHWWGANRVIADSLSPKYAISEHLVWEAAALPARAKNALLWHAKLRFRNRIPKIELR